MQDERAEEAPPTIVEQLHAIVDELFEPFGLKSPRANAFITSEHAPFDYQKPNQHDNKSAFRREQKILKDSIKHLDALEALMLADDDESPQAATLVALRPRLDALMKKNARSIALDGTRALVRRNFAEVGGSIGSLFLYFDLRRAMQQRLIELSEQEERFWNVPHRAPDYYAREIALRLARLYARMTKQKPTVGTSAMDGTPSTAFTKALAEIFKVLDISAQTRSPAEYAISQLTDADFKPPENALMRNALSMYAGSQPASGNGILGAMNVLKGA